MLRVLMAFAALLWASAAHAQLCPGSNQSWSFTVQPPQQFVVYDLTYAPPGLPPGLTTVLYLNDALTTAFVNVPQSIAQQWQVASNTYTFYQQRVLPVYHQVLLAQGQPGNNCAITGPDGYAIWID